MGRLACSDRAISGGAAEFDPFEGKLIVGLESWRASSLSLSGSNVVTWTDYVSGLVFDAVGTPVYSATSFNGKDGITFDGSSECFNNEDAGLDTLLGGTQEYEIWQLVQQLAPSGDPTQRYSFMVGISSLSRRDSRRNVAASTNRCAQTAGDGTNTNQIVNTLVDYTGYFMVRGIFKNGANELKNIVGSQTAQATAAAPINSSVARFRIASAGNASPSNFWAGQIASIHICELLTTDQATAVAAYLTAHK